MASPRSRRAAGPDAPVFDFDTRVLDSLPAGDADSLMAGRGIGLAYRDLALQDWVVASGDTVDGCQFDGLRADSWTARGARIVETAIVKADIPVVSAARTDVRDVVISDSRLGSVEAFDASWRSVRFVRCRLGFLNLRGSTLLDLAFEDCSIDEVDLLDAKARRIAFDDSHVRTLNVTGARLTDVDLRGAQLQEIIGLPGLRGATISPDQLQQMASAFAALAGVDVL